MRKLQTQELHTVAGGAPLLFPNQNDVVVAAVQYLTSGSSSSVLGRAFVALLFPFTTLKLVAGGGL